VALPTVVLVPLLVLTLHALSGLSPPKTAAEPEVVVTGWQWWWDVQYEGDDPQLRMRTANEIHIPVGRPVRVQLRSEDVIHSFWVPALQGKLDLVPGKVNTTWIQADSAGDYGGECAEYCGLQHTRMQFRVIALPAHEFAAWLEAQRAPAASPRDSLGREGLAVFMRSGCALCHAIRGTPAQAVSGPDLTHLASRGSFAGSMFEMNAANLRTWLRDPPGVKPGSKMPNLNLSSEEITNLVAYLQTLE
jgi:cytochrome c oxidase subunit 2